jgi:hypothetical protein
MKRRIASPALPANPMMIWFDIGWKTLEILLTAGPVMSMRLARMASAGASPTEADRREMHRMGAEKVVAFNRAGAAMAAGLAPWYVETAARAMRSAAVWNPWTSWAAATSRSRGAPGPWPLLPGPRRAARIVHSTLEPIHATVTANARRLSRRK